MTEGPGTGEPLGTWLRRQREAAGLSQDEVAGRSGLSVRAISNLERGRTRKPYPRSLRLLADALGLPETAGNALLTQYRAGRTGHPDPPPPARSGRLHAPRPGSGPGRPGPAAAAAPFVPRQLPAAVPYFAGRAAELKFLSGLLGRLPAAGEPMGATVPIAAIDGTAGVGKTALAVHWAHQVADEFPDGQLYLNLRGFDPAGLPVAPREAIRALLHALEVHSAPVPRIPADLAGQAALYRSLLAGQRMLILLDNARDAAQVRPLLPSSSGCLVIVTSRSALTGLAATEAADLVSLDVLTEDEAVELLAARLGRGRIAAEPAAVLELIRLCARLPVALVIAAALASAAPAQPLADLADDLADARHRLDALDVGEAAGNVRTVFSWSYRHLAPDTARLFRLLSLHPGPDITAPAAASLAGVGPRQARQALRELTGAGLLGERAPGRYACHDLLRDYAAEQASKLDSDADRHAALRRALDHCLHTAYAAALLLDPAHDQLALQPPCPGTAPEGLADDDEALAWFDAEHQGLLAAVGLAAGAGFDVHAWQLPWIIHDLLDRRGYWHECAASQRVALPAAKRLRDTVAQAAASRLLGHACTRLGDYDQAVDHLGDCLELYQQAGDRLGQARGHKSLGCVAGRQNLYAEAVGHCERALALFRAAGSRAGQADTLNSVGWYHILLGYPHRARAFCHQALALHREIGDRNGEAHAWDSLGYAESRLGRLAEADACYLRALGLFRELGSRYYEADTLTHLGDSRRAAGDVAGAREAWQLAAVLLDEAHHPDVEQVRARLSGVRQ